MINSILNAATSATIVFAAIYIIIGFLSSVANYRSFADATVIAFELLTESRQAIDSNGAAEATQSTVIQQHNLEEMTWRQLIKIAKAYGVKNRRNLTKVQLVVALQASV